MESAPAALVELLVSELTLAEAGLDFRGFTSPDFGGGGLNGCA